MRHLIVIVTVLALCASASAGEVKDGFKGHPWGDSVTAFDSTFGLTEAESPSALPGDTYYSAAIDSLGGAELSECSFWFYRGAFLSVMISTSSRTDSDRLKRALNKAYGAGEQENRYIEKYTYNSRKTYRIFEINRFTGAGTLTMASKAIYKQRDADLEAAAEKAKDEF